MHHKTANSREGFWRSRLMGNINKFMVRFLSPHTSEIIRTMAHGRLFASRTVRTEPRVNSAGRRALFWRILLPTLLLAVVTLPVHAGTLTPATGGGAIPSETVGGAFTALAGPVYEEAVAGEVGTGTIVLQLPAGFEWNTAASPTMLVEKLGNGGSNINQVASGTRIAATSVTAQQITFTITHRSTGNNNRNRITFENLAVRPLQTSPEASGDIVHAGTSVINSVATNVTSWGYLEQVPLQGNVALTANGQAISPVAAGVDEPVLFESTVFSCAVAPQWRDTWIIDGTSEQALFTDDACTRSPISRIESFATIGTYEVSFRSEYCTSFSAGTCAGWQLVGESSITIEVGNNVEPADAQLVLEYRMEARDWDGTADEIADTSGSAYHGVSENADSAVATPADPADPGTCRYGDLTGAGRVQGPVPAELNNEHEFSATLWLRMAAGTDASILAIGDLDGGSAERFELYQDSSGDLAARIRYDNGTQTLLTSAGSLVFDGAWHHVAVTRHFEPAAGNKTRVVERLYVDGAIVDPGASTEYPSGQWPASGLLRTATGNLHLAGFPSGARAGSLDLDELRLYTGGLTEAEVNAIKDIVNRCGYPAAFLVQVPATASVCAPAEVAISVLDGFGDLVPYYDGVAQLSTSSGRGLWSLVDANGSLSGTTTDDGADDYAFVVADGAAAVLGLSNQSADDLVISVIDSVAGISGSSAVLDFRENAFELVANDGLGNEVVAGRPHALQLRALRQDPSTGQCGLNTQYDGAIGLKLWLDRTAADPGGVAPEIGGVALPDAMPAGNNVTGNFSAGQADLTMAAADVGQYSIVALDDSSGLVEDETGTPRPVQGQSGLLTARPFGFAFSNIALGGVGNPGGATPAGSIFGPAGATFGLRLLAVGHQPSNDADDDGVPDAGVVLSVVGVTPAFAADGALSVGAFIPSEGVAGGLGGANVSFVGGDFINGEADLAELHYSEVGAVSLQAATTGYLGTSYNVSGRSGVIGRFTPAELAVTANTPFIENGCNATFSYLGQELDYLTAPEIVITPRNVQGATTQNYADFSGAGGANWWRITNDIVPNYVDMSADFPNATLEIDHSGASHAPGAHQPSGVDAEVTMVFAGPFSYAWKANTGTPPAPQQAPFDSELYVYFNVVDADGIGYDGGADIGCEDEGNNCYSLRLRFNDAETQRHGRLRLPNAHGSELLDLKVPLRTQYFASANEGFVDNINDDCTQNLRLTLTPATLSCAFEDGTTSGIGCGEAKAGRNWADPVIGGDFNLWLRAAGATGSAELGVDGSAANLPLWLRYDWDNNGDHDNWPSGITTFGIYSGNERQIDRRERW